MEKSNIVDKRSIRLEEITKTGYIPFLGGRPIRATVISHDDCINLTILINTIDTVDELLEKLNN